MTVAFMLSRIGKGVFVAVGGISVKVAVIGGIVAVKDSGVDVSGKTNSSVTGNDSTVGFEAETLHDIKDRIRNVKKSFIFIIQIVIAFINSHSEFLVTCARKGIIIL